MEAVLFGRVPLSVVVVVDRRVVVVVVLG